MNVLLPNQFHRLYTIKIPRIRHEVTGNAGQFTANYGKCCSSVPAPDHHHEIATAMP
jgi:hypothetical protein